MSSALDIWVFSVSTRSVLVRNHIHWLGKSYRVFCLHEHLNLARMAGRDCQCGTNVAYKDYTSKEMSSKRIHWCVFPHKCNRFNSIIFQSCVKNAQQVPKMTCQRELMKESFWPLYRGKNYQDSVSFRFNRDRNIVLVGYSMVFVMQGNEDDVRLCVSFSLNNCIDSVKWNESILITLP